MPTTHELLFEAEALLASGRLAEAEARCRRALAGDPTNVTALNFLGQIAGAAGRFDVAEQCFRQTIAHRPDFVRAHSNLGVALQLQGKAAEAVEAFRRAIALAPRSADLHRRLGGALEELGARDAAIESCRTAIELQPDHAESCNSLGVLLQRNNALDEAIVLLRRAVALAPDFADAYSNLGAALDERGKSQEAVGLLERALMLRPDFVEAHINLGSALEGLRRYDDACVVLERAIALQPNCVEALVNLGLVLIWLARFDRAQSVLTRAVALAPNSADAQVNLALALDRQGHTAAAAEGYRRALALDPNCAEAHLNFGMLRLREGRFGEGWPGYQWRSRLQRTGWQPRAGALWNGEPLGGRTILLDDEQGLGDSMQFVRFARLVKERGATVIVECRPPLASLFHACPGVDAVAVAGDPTPAFDVHLPLASLPGVLGIELESLSADVPYLFPDAALVEKWKHRFAGATELKVGIAWAGNPENITDRQRSIPLEQFGRLAGVAGVRLYSIQLGSGRRQLTEAAAPPPITDLADEIHDFQDTAAIMRNLDLVITCDSAPAHLAGALGVPVWAALSQVADWRWLVDRTDSPWYPTMRLFRQREPGNWPEVFDRIVADLSRHCE